jgi:AraC family transcriptional regulator of adaptative response/methylated-DNA-[protein]-cysteine methyltransferase
MANHDTFYDALIRRDPLGWRARSGSPRRHAAALRERRSRSALRDGTSVADAAFGSGFGSGSRLYENAPATLGMTPAEFPAAALERAEDRLESAAAAIVRYLSAAAPLPELLLDVRAGAKTA